MDSTLGNKQKTPTFVGVFIGIITPILEHTEIYSSIGGAMVSRSGYPVGQTFDTLQRKSIEQHFLSPPTESIFGNSLFSRTLPVYFVNFTSAWRTSSNNCLKMARVSGRTLPRRLIRYSLASTSRMYLWAPLSISGCKRSYPLLMVK